MVINMNNYEGYFNYKTNRNEFNFSFEEYVVWNLYNGKFQKPYSVQKKSGFFCSFNNLYSKYSKKNVPKLEQVK